MKDDIDTPNNENAKPAYPIYPDTKLLKNGTRKVLKTRDNVKALCDFIDYEPKMNLMTNDIHIPPSISPEITTTEDFMSYLISEGEKYDLSETAIKNHFGSICNANCFHPIRD